MNYLQDHITLCRSYLNEINEGESDWTDAELLTYIDAENQHLSAMVRKKNEDFFGYREIFPVVSGQAEYYFPRTLATLRWVEMITSGVTGSAPDYVVDEVNRVFSEIPRADTIRSLYAPTFRRNFRAGYTSEQYLIYNDKIIFSPATDLSGHIRLWFIRTLPKLHYGTAAAGSSTTITLAASPTLGWLHKDHDIYTGCLIGIYSGAGVGQVRRITDYNATTRVATVDETWLSYPDTSSIYSLISPVPEQMQELLPIGAALRGAGKMSDDQNRFYQLYQSIVTDFLGDIDPRDRTRSRRVRSTRN